MGETRGGGPRVEGLCPIVEHVASGSGTYDVMDVGKKCFKLKPWHLLRVDPTTRCAFGMAVQGWTSGLCWRRLAFK